MSIVLTRSVVFPFTAETVVKTDSFSVQDSSTPTSPAVYDRLLRTDSVSNSEAASLLEPLLKTDSLNASELQELLDALLRSDFLDAHDRAVIPTDLADIAKFRSKGVKGWDILFGPRKDWGTRMEPRKNWGVRNEPRKDWLVED
jgi:hypothetical protein